jgi:hypothetical protein
VRVRLPALWAVESRLQFGGFEAEDVGEKGGKKKDVVRGNRGGTSLELSDRVMEQVEAMVKELRRISREIQALVEGVGKLTEVVIGLGKKEVEKKDREIEMETVQRVDWEVKMEIVEEESEGEEGEEEKGDSRKEDKADKA